MQRPAPLTFARWVSTPENRSALAAVQDVLAHLGPGRSFRYANPLLLHGPAGTGKTHLVSALAADAARQHPTLVITLRAASDFRTLPAGTEMDDDACLPDKWGDGDLLIVEDLQHLPASAVETLVQGIDALQARRVAMVFTALAGPRHLPYRSARLASRLIGGLVVELEPLGPASRLTLLEDQAQRRQLAVGAEVLGWLAEHLTGGGRQLEGAIAQLEMLTRLHERLPDVAMVADHFRVQAEAGRPTMERIVQRVGGYFQVAPKLLQSRRRSRQVLLPRQVGMYLARQLTGLSLEQIGAYFGGRDHSTVLHACRKIENALADDAGLSGAVRQLHSDLA